MSESKAGTPRRTARKRPPQEIPVHRRDENEKPSPEDPSEPEDLEPEDQDDDEDPVEEEPEDDDGGPENADEGSDEDPQGADEEGEEEPEYADEESEEEPEYAREEFRHHEHRRRRLTARRAAFMALEQLVELTGRAAEGIVAIEKDDDGWRVTIEAVEDRHVPSTADIMAEYEVELDADGELVAYHRRSRYVRGQVRD